MKIQNINTVRYGVRPYAKNAVSKKDDNAAKKSLTTAATWLGFGLGLDLVSRKCTVFKSPLKNSMLINGSLALCTVFKSPLKNSMLINGSLALVAGGYTYIKSKMNNNERQRL